MSAWPTLLAVALVGATGCGVDVDLGGTADAAAQAMTCATCDPCATTADCHSGVCVNLGGNGYCATLCAQNGVCDSTETCGASATTSGETPNACLPASGKCPLAAGPTAPDGAPLERCEGFVGPGVPAMCHACGPNASCQLNGCYGGWWCETSTCTCHRPPNCL